VWVLRTADTMTEMTDSIVDPDKFVTVGKFLEPVNAQMAKGMLESAGIECFLQGENANSLLAPAFLARLLVHKQDEEAARQLLGSAADELTEEEQRQLEAGDDES
jgi:Putative prokaryotic signal transducing protein